MVFTKNSPVAQFYPDLLHLLTINGMHCRGDAIKVGEDFGARTTDLEWVQVHPTGLGRQKRQQTRRAAGSGPQKRTRRDPQLPAESTARARKRPTLT